MNRITEKRNYLAITVAAVATMFLVTTGLASADHEVPFGPLVKSTDCPTEVDVKPSSAIACSFTMTYSGGVEATISDTVPAEWQVMSTTGTCDVDQANKKMNKKSATKINCTVAGDEAITVNIESRHSNGKKHVDVYKPTSCGFLDINDGAHATDANGIVIASTAPLTPIVVNDPEDTDCDGETNDVDVDDDGDGILDVDETPGCELDPNC